MIRQNRPNVGITQRQDGKHELPVGSEIIIGLTLGLIGWWGIVHAVIWIAGH